MINRFLQAWTRPKAAEELDLHFDRPLVLFQSDDWGRVGVRDRSGWEELQRAGLKLGEKPYDHCSLETADDLQALRDVLARHRDSVGRHPCLKMNFIMANVDFPRCAEAGLREVPLRPLTDGLPDAWVRPGLMEAYQEGIQENLFRPGLHGLTHFCMGAVARELERGEERSQVLHTLWRACTPYIHWRMPWVGYEYWDPALSSDRRFLPLAMQQTMISRAAEIYRGFFGSIPFSACAPGYRANQATKSSWFQAGVRVVQGGPGERRGPCLDQNGMLLTFRNVEMEPATEACELGAIVEQANDCLTRGLPAVVSIHSINFQSTLRDFRTTTLGMLDRFLGALERRWPELLYVHDENLWEIATAGFFAGEAENIKVSAAVPGKDG